MINNLSMGKAKSLSDFEKGKIEALREENYSNRAIAKKIERSEHCIRIYLKSKEGRIPIDKKRGPKLKLNGRVRRRIIKEASQKSISLAQIKSHLNLKVCKETIRTVLNENQHTKLCKMKRKPVLTSVHKERRLKWAEERASYIEEWKRIIWSDEKRFNLDGPDGFAYYWHDLRKDELILSKRHSGGGSVMIWACFSYHGKSTLAFVKQRMNQYSYQNVLENYLLPFKNEFGGDNSIFQQDGAKPHTARTSIQWLVERNIEVLPWPSLSPDLSPIENLWGYLTRMVYSNGIQYNSVEELKMSILSSWNRIPKTLLENLAMSMPKRIFKVGCSKGGVINY